MTSSTRALDLFLRRSTDTNRIDWLANQLLALAAESQSFSLRLGPGEDGIAWVLEAFDADQLVSTREPGPVRVFRTVLARLAKLAEQETGAAFNPYGGKLWFDRTSPTGPARVIVDFINAGDGCSLTMTRSACPGNTLCDEGRGGIACAPTPVTPATPRS
ncbi:MAG: hypothetical protein JWO38_7076 [Gemmataceae bacterium]|nr:hypothetical protein [Gemmataceae bacterium]